MPINRRNQEVVYLTDEQAHVLPSPPANGVATFTGWVVTPGLEVKPLRVHGPWPVETGEPYRDFINGRTLIMHQRGVALRFGESLNNRLYATEDEALDDAMDHLDAELLRLATLRLNLSHLISTLRQAAYEAQQAQAKPQSKRTRRGAAEGGNA